MPTTVYHLQTLALTMVTVSGITFLCLAPALLRFAQEYRSAMRSWLLGTALVVSTDVIFFLGIDLPYLTAVLIAIAGLGVAEWIHALRLYVGHARRIWWPYAVIAVAAICALAMPSYPMTVLVTSVLYAILYLGAARFAAAVDDPPRSVGRFLLVTIFVFIALVMIARLALFVSGIRSGAPEGFTTTVRALMFIVASIAPIAASLAFVIASGERLGERLLRWSLTDALTEIPNRRALFEALGRTMASGRRRREPVSLLVIDLDHFKRVNDSAGHEAGDRALASVASRLVHAARSEDTVARLGGEEFAVVTPGADLTAALALAERLRHAVADTPVDVDGRAFALTASIGVVEWDSEEDASSLLSRADRLLYQAKGSGRNLVMS